MKIVAITGSIGTGKTTLAQLVRGLGYGVFDVDAWVRRLYFKKDFIEVIVKAFPETVENGVFNKRNLRNLVFSDNKRLKKLESLIHPFLNEELKLVIRKNYKSTDILFIDVALLFEMGWDKYCDLVILTTVDYEIQKQRVMLRDNITGGDFEKIVKVQMGSEEKILRSDVIVDTNQTMNLLRLELINILTGVHNG